MHTLKRISLASAAALLIGSTATAAPLMIDMGPTGGNVQAGWTGWQIAENNDAPGNSVTTLVGADFGGFGTPGSDQVRLTASADGSIRLRARTYSYYDGSNSPDNYDTLATDANLFRVLDDVFQADSSTGTLTLTFEGLDAGNYTITTYHNNVQYTVNDGGPWTLSLTDANGAGQSLGSVDASTIDDNGETVVEEIVELTFNFTSNGTDDVSITITGTDNRPTINGFVLDTAVPEPASMALLGTGLACISFRRRR